MQLYLFDMGKLPPADDNVKYKVIVKLEFHKPHNACYRYGVFAGVAELAAKFGGGLVDGEIGPHKGSVFRATRIFGFSGLADAKKYRDAARKNGDKGFKIVTTLH